MDKYQMLVGGAWVDAASGEWIESVNPFTALPWALIPRGGKQDIERAVRSARRAFYEGEWRKLTASARGHRDHRQRKAVRGDARAAELYSAVVLLFRRPRGQDRRARHSHR